MIYRFRYLAAPILALLVGCGEAASVSESKTTPAPDSSSPATPSKPTAPPLDPSIVSAVPEDVNYTVIDEDIMPGIKRSLDIRLSRRVSGEVLNAIARKLKNSDSNTYDRTFIGYYLPEMKLNAGYWATTHFNPTLEVRILGLTVEQEEALKRKTGDPSRQIIGRWIDGRPFGGGRIAIFRKGDKLFIENKYKDGSVGEAEIVETPSSRGRRFDYSPDRGNGEYYLINSKGDLQELDEDGSFMTAKKI